MHRVKPNIILNQKKKKIFTAKNKKCHKNCKEKFCILVNINSIPRSWTPTITLSYNGNLTMG